MRAIVLGGPARSVVFGKVRVRGHEVMVKGRVVALLGPGAPAPFLKYGLLRTGTWLIVKEGDLRPLTVEHGKLIPTQYAPDVYAGMVREQVLTRHYRGLDWRSMLPWFVLLGFGALLAFGLMRA